MLKIIFTFFLLFANEHPTEEKSAASSEHGAAEGKEKKELPEWLDLQNQISTLEAKITQKKEIISKLIEEKQHLPTNSPQIKETIDELVKEHKEYERLIIDYDKKITIFKFRYPERGAKAERKYSPADLKSMNQLEKELGVEGKLNRNQRKMRSQFKSKEVKKKSDAAKLESSTPESAPSIIDQKTIILEK